MTAAKAADNIRELYGTELAKEVIEREITQIKERLTFLAEIYNILNLKPGTGETEH